MSGGAFGSTSGARPDGPPQGLTQIGKGARVTGELEGSGLLLIHGEVSGSLRLEGDIVVAPGGRTRALRAKSSALRVEGAAEGDFRVLGRVEVVVGGNLTGSVAGRTLEMSAGAALEGVVTITS